MKTLIKFIIILLFFTGCISQANDFSKLNWENAENRVIYGRVETLDPPILKGKDNNYYIIYNETNVDFFKYKNQFLIITGKLLLMKEREDSSFILKPEKVEPLVQNIKDITPDKNPQPKEEEINLIGLLALGKDNNLVIITDWESRSRISHYVKGIHKEYLLKHVGSYVKVTGVVLSSDVDNPWKKDFMVSEIQSLSVEPPQ